MNPLSKAEWRFEEKKGHIKKFPERSINQIRDRFMNFTMENLGSENRRYDAKLDNLYVEAMKNNSDNFGLQLGKEKDLAAMLPSKCEDVGESSKKNEKIEVIGEIGKEPEELTRKKSNKGQPWSMEEHELFLYGMQKYGRGKWHRICRELLKTRTPTQVASHAQKYFNRHKTPSDRRRSSIHDIRLPNKDAVVNTNIAIPLNKYGHCTNCKNTIPNGNYVLSTNSSNVIPTINWGLFEINTNATSNSNYGYFANNLVRGCVSCPIGLSRDICTEAVMFFGGQQQPFDPTYQGSSIFKFF